MNDIDFIDCIEALKRLVAVSHHDTGQAARVRGFLLAWWNGRRDGGFDLANLWAVDTCLKVDMLRVISLIASRPGVYPNEYVARENFEAFVKMNKREKRRRHRSRS